jgi:hypothetical protein
VLEEQRACRAASPATAGNFAGLRQLFDRPKVKIWRTLAPVRGWFVVASVALLVACAGPRRTPHERRPTASFSLRPHGTPVRFYLDEPSRLGFVTAGGFTTDVRPMWTAFAADVDGDGADEVILGVWSTTHRLDEPEPHRTLWVMRWTGSRLEPLFRGSALVEPLIDARALPGPKGDELSALERDPGGGCSRARYRWTGFGFGVVAREPDSCPE